jgi:cytoplasmic iron level regulating protein YaaA (DUF328/UPF0246 family)
MLIVISPAKSLDTNPVDLPMTAPRFPGDAAKLAARARRLTLGGLRDLMSISDDLARLNRDRWRDWETAEAKPALRLYAGDTYAGLDAATLSEDALRAAQDRLRILSGLYGLLRPLDAIVPHRLEMGTRLDTRRGRDLYAFWGDRIAETLNADAEAAGTGLILNCASREYFRAADRAALRPHVITPTFLEARPGGPKLVSFAAKRARGAMARFVLEHRIDDPADLRAFAAGGYEWQESPPDAPVFLRSGDAARAA